MITEAFLIKTGFRKVTNLEITIGNYFAKPAEFIPIKSDAYVLGDVPEEYLTIILSPRGPLAIVGAHDAPPDERENFPFDDSEEDVFNCIENWTNISVKRPNPITMMKMMNTEKQIEFNKGLALGYWVSIDLLKDKFSRDYSFDSIFAGDGNVPIKHGLCVLLLKRMYLNDESIGELMDWLESPVVSLQIGEIREYLRLYGSLMETNP